MAGSLDAKNFQLADKPPLQPSLLNGASVAPPDVLTLANRSCSGISMLNSMLSTSVDGADTSCAHAEDRQNIAIENPTRLNAVTVELSLWQQVR